MEQHTNNQYHQNTPNHASASNHPLLPDGVPSLAHAPATLLPTVLHQLGLDNDSLIYQPTIQHALNDLQNSDWQIRIAAVHALGKLDLQAPIEPLLGALQDEDDSVRAAAIHVLATLGERVPIESLIAALYDPAWHVRETAILALAQCRQPLPPNVFDTVLRDQDSTVREAAQLALQWKRSGGLGTVPATRPSQNYLSAQNNYAKRHRNTNNQGASMREQRTQPTMQDPEYSYYAYNGEETNRQWEKVTSYAPKKNRKPLWIGGLLGVAVFFIAAAGAWTFFAQSSKVSQIDYIQQATSMPKVMPTPGLPAQTVFIYQNHHAPVNAVAWSPDSTRIASASDDTTVQVWDALTGNNPYIFKDHITPVKMLAWSPNGQLIASGSADGTIEVWNPNNGRVELTYHFAQAADIAHIGALQATSGGYAQGTYTLAWSPDGSRIAAAMDSSVVRVFDVHNGNTLFTYASPSDKILAMAWSPNGKYIITAGANDTTTIWNAHNGTTVFVSMVSSSSIFSLAWSPDSTRVAIGSIDGTVQFWQPFSGNSPAVHIDSQNVYALAWSPDGTRLATSTIDGTVQFFNTTTGLQIFAYYGQLNELRSMAWSPDGSFIAFGSSDDTVQVWKAP